MRLFLYMNTRAIRLLAFSSKNNQSPSHSFSDKKVKGIVYSDKSTIIFNLAELKSRSPYQAQPLRQNVMNSDIAIGFSTNPTSTKKCTIKNLFWVRSFCTLGALHTDKKNVTS